ncbi:MAG: DUF4293 domain-containing protein [Flavobacteriaceae bacterium]|nr:DUF4293 domain-containing protein [Flavobacteriaceae bacterium]
MIQRIQSLYLLVSSLFYFNYWFFGMEWFKKGFLILKDILAQITIPEFIFVIISFNPLLIVVLCLASILLFSNRPLQYSLSRLAFGLSLFMCLFSVFYFYNVLQDLIEIMPSKTLEFFMYAAILNPFICSYLIYLAMNSIKKDDDLVRSLNRIR